MQRREIGRNAFSPLSARVTAFSVAYDASLARYVVARHGQRWVVPTREESARGEDGPERAAVLCGVLSALYDGVQALRSVQASDAGADPEC